MPETCCACLAVMTALEREYAVEGMCAECGELAHELIYFARRPVWYGEAPKGRWRGTCDPTTSAPDQDAGTSGESTTRRGASQSSAGTSVVPTAPALSNLRRLRLSREWPSRADRIYFVIAAVVAVAVFCWRWMT